MRTRVHYFLFESIAFEKDGFLVMSWWCLIRYFKKQISAAKLLFFVVLLYFFTCVYMQFHLDTALLQYVIGIFTILTLSKKTSESRTVILSPQQSSTKLSTKVRAPVGGESAEECGRCRINLTV
jgi:hypothetical protein